MTGGSFGFQPIEAEKEENSVVDPALLFVPKPVDRPHIPLAQLDAVAASAGFSSREPVATQTRRRRRTVPKLPQRTLPIRLVEDEYQRFLRFADQLGMTYSETVSWLMDEANNKTRS